MPTAPSYCRSSVADCPQALRQCTARVPLSTSPRQCGNSLQIFQRPLPPDSLILHCSSFTAECAVPTRQYTVGVPLTTFLGFEAGHCSSFIARCPRAVCSALEEFYFQILSGRAAKHFRSCIPDYRRLVSHCIAGAPLPCKWQ